MKTHSVRRCLTLLSAFVLFFIASSSSANTALWVAESNGLLRIALADESVVFEITDAAGTEAIAIDNHSGRIWAYGPGRLRAYNSKGNPEVDVAAPGIPQHTPITDMVADGDGVWIAAHHGLFRFDPEGQLKKALDFSKPVTAMTLDTERLQLWAAVPEQLFILDGSGTVVKQLTPSFPRTWQLEYDASLDSVWVAGGPFLFRINASDHVQELSPREALEQRFSHYLSADGQGGVWGGTRHSISHVNEDGEVAFTFRPFHGRSEQEQKVQDLVADTEDGSVWLANALSIQQYSMTGSLQKEFIPDPGDGVIRAITRLGLEKAPQDPPEIEILSPFSGSFTNNATPRLVLSYSSSGVIDTDSIAITRNGTGLDADCVADEVEASCRITTELPDGETALKAVIADTNGQLSEPAEVTFTIDTVAPEIHIQHPEDGLFTNQPELTLRGELSKPVSSLSLNTGSGLISLSVEGNAFSHSVSLEEGLNHFELQARDRAGNTTRRTRTVTLDTVPPAMPVSEGISVTLSEEGSDRITGAEGSVEPESLVRITNTRTGESVTVRADTSGGFVAELAAWHGDRLQITVEDSAGNQSENMEVPVSHIPPDPVRVAPSLGNSGVTPMDEAVAFLYTGNYPIQTGVAEGTIEKDRVAVIRGRVMTRDGTPLKGVSIQVHNHPELGNTVSRVDGAFDMAVNGGGPLTVEYQKEGYLPVQRKIQTPWKAYAWVDDVVMVDLDGNATAVDLSTSTEYQVARGSEEEDEAGARQATLLFPSGVGAEMVLPDGSRAALTSGTVRATEYTVGSNGFEAMPGELPPTSAYTYAVELSLDEAIHAGAERVDFDQPIPLYVDNFLDFPTGEIVPAGFYDRNAAAWRAGDNGRVIEVLQIDNGLATLDVTGNGLAATQAELDSLGITDGERRELAQLYAEGKTLWRTPISHFTPWDCNWPYGPPADAVGPDVPEPGTNDSGAPENSKESCKKPGCIINALGQTLGESVAVTGTPFELVYSSDRTEGYANNATQIQLTGEEVPSSLEGIKLSVTIAGQPFSREFSPATNLSHEFQWDGLDGYGRKVRGAQQARVEVSYLYPCVYRSANPNVTRAWARTNNLSAIGTRSNCQSTVLTRDWEVTLESPFKVRPDTVGAWSLSAHHAYDPHKKVLHLGNGERRAPASPSITTVAGTGEAGFSGDGEEAINAELSWPRGIDMGADGSLYFSTGHKIRRIDPKGIISTVAGTGEAGFGGDGGIATKAQLNNPRGLAVTEEGGLYIADSKNFRVRYVSPEGMISTVAGSGGIGSGGDDGLAVEASLSRLQGVTPGPVSGSFYIADTYDSSRIRYVDPDGIISTVTTSPNRPYDMAVTDNGTLFALSTYTRRVLKISPQGEVTTIGGGYGASADGVPATSIDIGGLSGMALGPDQSVYFAETSRGRVRRIDPYGIITTVAGTGEDGFSGDGGAPELAQVNRAYDVVVGPDGSIYFTDSANHRIRRVIQTVASGPDQQGALIPSADGSELYRFDAMGRHLSTRDAATGAIIHTFAYDEEGHLVRITDAYQNVTTIERDSNGHARAIIAADGQRTDLSTNTRGHLTAISNPAGNTWAATYSDRGLMLSFETPNHHVTRFDYNDNGRLIRDEAPNGGGWEIERTPLDNGFRTDMTSGEGRLSRFTITHNAIGERHFLDEAPDNTVTKRVIARTGATVTQPSGTVIRHKTGPDPRFGLLVPVPEETTITTPAGLKATLTTQRSAVLEDLRDPLSHTQLSNTVTVNGRTSTAIYDASSHQWTATSAQGRTSTTRLDDNGRPEQSQVADLAALDYRYDERGRLSALIAGDGADQRSTHMAYDSLGNLSRITDALGRNVSYQYDPAGRVTRQTLPDGGRIDFDYDGNGNLRLLQPPGREAHLFDYNSVDLEEAYSPPELPEGATVTRYSYNRDRQLTQINRPDGQSVILDYDFGGRLSQVTLPHGSVHYDYQPDSGQLATITAPDGGQLHYGYDGDLPLSERWSGPITGDITRRYDNNFRVRGLNVSGVEFPYDYDNDGLLTRAGAMELTPDAANGLLRSTTLDSVTTGHDYNPFGELDHSQATVNGDALHSTRYQRDALGRIVEKTETLDGVTTSYTYDYDPAGRLERVAQNGTTTDSYQYDANGNRLSHNGTSATYDAQDRLLSYGQAQYDYTEAGELQSITDNGLTTRFDYDVMGNLRQVQLPGDTTIDYLIDGRDRRIGKQVNGELVQGFLYQDQLNPVAELDGEGNVVARFVYADKINVPAYMVKDGTTYRIISDHLGSPRLVVDTATGNIAHRMDYDAYGEVIEDTNPGFQPFGYAGGIYDPHTGLVRFGARDYSAEIGRWTAKDPIGLAGGDVNFYGYVWNDPKNYLDPTGEVGVLGAVVGAGIGGVSSFVGTLASGGSLTEASINATFGIASGAVAGFLPGGTFLRSALSGGALGGTSNAVSQTAVIINNDCKSFGNDFNVGSLAGSFLGGMLSGGMHAHAPSGILGQVVTAPRNFGVNLAAGGIGAGAGE